MDRQSRLQPYIVDTAGNKGGKSLDRGCKDYKRDRVMADRGRPTEYRQAFNKQAYKLCLLGSTDEQLADFFGVNVTTIETWKKVHAYFLRALKRGKEHADAEVAESLYKRALGYSHKEDKIFCTDGKVTTVETVKHYPPDTAAAFIWLKNRAGWRDKHEHIVKGSLDLVAPAIG